MKRNKPWLGLAILILIVFVSCFSQQVEGQKSKGTSWSSFGPSRQNHQNLWGRLNAWDRNSEQGAPREGKTLRNTFPFNQGDSAGHQHHHGHETTNARGSSFRAPSSLGRGFNPPDLDNRLARQRGGGGDDDIAVDKGDVFAAGERCIDKVVMVEETEYDEVVTCKHSYSERCHTTYVTDFTPQQEEECEENFKKNCFIEYKNQASEEQVEFCFTPLVRNCDIPGPTECTTEYTSQCTTRYHEHDVDDDVVDCVDEVEEKCESKTQGYSTSEECTKWPVRKCSVEPSKTKKYSPETDCKKVPYELCGPGACPVEPGEEECQDRKQTVVQEVPEETCTLEPQRICKHVTKLVPHLKARENCIDIPKEVCSRSRTNPRKVQKPIVKKWCYEGVKPKTTRPPPTRRTTKRPTRPTRRGTGGGDNRQGGGRTTKRPDTGGDTITKKKKECRKVKPRCRLTTKVNRREIDIDAVNCNPECHHTKCGYRGGECRKVEKTTPKSTYLPPKKGY